MSKFSRPRSWKEHRLADSIELAGGEYRVDLLARQATGVHGFRVTVVFMPRGGGTDVERELPNAASTADVHRVVRELSGNEEGLRQLFEEGSSK